MIRAHKYYLPGARREWCEVEHKGGDKHALVTNDELMFVSRAWLRLIRDTIDAYLRDNYPEEDGGDATR